MAQLGFRTMDEMIGHSECLEMKGGARPLEGAGHRPVEPSSTSRRSGPTSASRCTMAQNHGLEKEFDDTTLIPRLPAGAGARREGAGRRCPSATSTAPWAPAWAARSPGASAPRACPRTPSRCTSGARPGRASWPSCPGGSPSCWRATPTTTWARGCRAASCWCARRRTRCSPRLPRTTSSSATSPSTAPPAARPTSGAWPASASACATAACRRWSRGWGTTAANT